MRFFRFLVIVVLLGGVLAAAAAYLLGMRVGPSTETFVDLPAGVGTDGIAQRLAQAGIIRNRYAFDLYKQLHGGTLRAGEYRFDHPANLPEVFARIARGDVYTHTLVVPEGFNIFDIAQAVKAAGLGDAAEFLKAERRNTALIADLSPQANSLEGYLFPDTYHFSRHTTPEQMLAMMVKRFRTQSRRLGLLDRPDVAKIVTLASLVEKEVRVGTERPLVAGVFDNRLAAGMPLDTDPSVVYAALLANHWRGKIYRSDLDFNSPYNTYRHAGLPPGPIANPGVAAIQAALNPTQSDYLYFVADAQGHTRFSVDLKEHAKQVQDYRNSIQAAQP
jgi:UPF0755 protein